MWLRDSGRPALVPRSEFLLLSRDDEGNRAVPSAIQPFQPVVGDPLALVAVFEGDPEAWLAEPRRDGVADRWLVVLHAGALHRTVRLRIGDPWRSGPNRWRSLSWVPVGADGEAASTDRLLPSFDGELGLHLGALGRATLVLDGSYEPPGGRFGTAVDSIALQRLARLTTTSLVAATATRISAEAQALEESRTDPAD